MALLLLVYLHPAHFGHRRDSLWATNIFRNERHTKSERLPNFIKHSPKRCNKHKIEAIFCYSLLKSVLFSALSWKVRSSTWPCKKGTPKKFSKKSFCLTAFLKARKTLSFTAPGRLKCIIKEQILKYLDDSAKRTWYDIKSIVSV